MKEKNIRISYVSPEHYSSIAKCIGDYSKKYLLSQNSDLLYKLYIFLLPKPTEQIYSLNNLKGGSKQYAWSDILMSTGLSEIFGINKQKYKETDFLESFHSTYSCLVLAGMYIFPSSKTVTPKELEKHPKLWHSLDQLSISYDADHNSFASPQNQCRIIHHLKMDYSQKELMLHLDAPTSSDDTPDTSQYKITRERKQEILEKIQKMARDFKTSTGTDVSVCQYEAIPKETKNNILYDGYLSPIIRAIAVSFKKFPYFPNESLFKKYVAYDKSFEQRLGINERMYLSLQQTIRYIDHTAQTPKDVKAMSPSVFLEKYYAMLDNILKSLHQTENNDSSLTHYEKFPTSILSDTVGITIYYYLAEEIYGYYLFSHETRLIQNCLDDKNKSFSSLSKKEKRKLGGKLHKIFTDIDVIASPKAAEEIIHDFFGNKKRIKYSNPNRLNDYERSFNAKPDKYYKSLLYYLKTSHKNNIELFNDPEKISEELFPIIKDLLEKLVKGTAAPMITYYAKCHEIVRTPGTKFHAKELSHISDTARDVALPWSCNNPKKHSEKYDEILTWVIKKSVGDKWYNYSRQKL